MNLFLVILLIGGWETASLSYLYRPSSLNLAGDTGTTDPYHLTVFAATFTARAPTFSSFNLRA